MHPRSGFLSKSLHLILFLITFFTTTLAGVSWANVDYTELTNFPIGLPYSISILAILTAHEFGHYFAARHYGIETTLPYFIPIPHMILNPFGTMGAVIKIKSPLTKNRMLFDIGIAGPLAGLVVTFAILAFGLLTLPPKTYILTIHPDYANLPAWPLGGLSFGDSILFHLLSKLPYGTGYFPPMSEIYHYPYLCAAWFGMFVTALNLMPVGQLDGGHILYALVGTQKQHMVAKIFFGALVFIGLAGLLPLFDSTIQPGTSGWLLWALIMYFLIKLKHPVVPDTEEMDQSRRMLGWGTLLSLVFIFPPIPIMG